MGDMHPSSKFRYVLMAVKGLGHPCVREVGSVQIGQGLAFGHFFSQNAAYRAAASAMTRHTCEEGQAWN